MRFWAYLHVQNNHFCDEIKENELRKGYFWLIL